MCLFLNEFKSVLISIPEISGFLFSSTAIEFQKKSNLTNLFLLNIRNTHKTIKLSDVIFLPFIVIYFWSVESLWKCIVSEVLCDEIMGNFALSIELFKIKIN